MMANCLFQTTSVTDTEILHTATTSENTPDAVEHLQMPDISSHIVEEEDTLVIMKCFIIQ